MKLEILKKIIRRMAEIITPLEMEYGSEEEKAIVEQPMNAKRMRRISLERLAEYNSVDRNSFYRQLASYEFQRRLYEPEASRSYAALFLSLFSILVSILIAMFTH